MVISKRAMVASMTTVSNRGAMAVNSTNRVATVLPSSLAMGLPLPSRANTSSQIQGRHREAGTQEALSREVGEALVGVTQHLG